MKHVELFGFAGSTYVRTARMVCIEKHIDHQLQPLAFGAESHRALHPFLRMPVMRVAGLVLYETLAIGTYLDEAFEGPRLMPDAAADRARALQWISTCNDYVYRDLVSLLAQHDAPCAAQLEPARRDLEIVDRQLTDMPFLLGNEMHLCDLFLAPMVAFARAHAAGPGLLRGLDHLQSWCDRMASRASFGQTQP
jgi:glutathione S-transferase